MRFTVAAAVKYGTKIKAQLATIETAHPGDADILLLHALLNTVAIALEDEFNQVRGTFGGSEGTFHPDTGGTDKGGP